MPGIGPVDTDDIVKGYEVEKGKYVLLTDEEIDDVKLEAKKSIDLVQFVDEDEIDPIYFERPFYVLPSEEDDEDAEEAYVVLRDALRKTKKVGLGQIVVRGQGSIVAIKPCGKGLLMETLRYADEVKKAGRQFDSVPAKKRRQGSGRTRRGADREESRRFPSRKIQGHLHGRASRTDRREAWRSGRRRRSRKRRRPPTSST